LVSPQSLFHISSWGSALATAAPRNSEPSGDPTARVIASVKTTG
jgi:hypothetical protein